MHLLHATHPMDAFIAGDARIIHLLHVTRECDFATCDCSAHVSVSIGLTFAHLSVLQCRYVWFVSLCVVAVDVSFGPAIIVDCCSPCWVLMRRKSHAWKTFLSIVVLHLFCWK